MYSRSTTSLSMKAPMRLQPMRTALYVSFMACQHKTDARSAPRVRVGVEDAVGQERGDLPLTELHVRGQDPVRGLRVGVRRPSLSYGWKRGWRGARSRSSRTVLPVSGRSTRAPPRRWDSIAAKVSSVAA